jgi:cell division protein FtsN
VRIGPFETRELANQVRDRAKSQGYDAMVVTP